MLLENLPHLFAFIANSHEQHARNTPFHETLSQLFKGLVLEAKESFESKQPVSLGEYGAINLPYKKMGAIESLNLFELDELIIFAFYWKNRNQYSRTIDIGGNLGLHSIMMGKCGFNVNVFEPDPDHFSDLKRNISLNNLGDLVTPNCQAVSDKNTTMQFTRVLGNTTSSHLTGVKDPYGDLEQFDVDVVSINNVIQGVNLAKIDAEGHEDVILAALDADVWNELDAFVEISNDKNAKLVYDYATSSGVNVFCQKLGWKAMSCLDDMPKSYKDGSIFVSRKESMPW